MSSGEQNLTSFVMRIFFLALAVIIGLALITGSVPGIENSSLAKIVIAIAITPLLAVLMMTIVGRLAPQPKQGVKRDLEGLDMYTVIDRLVEDLDEDEVAYLQRRLEEREFKAKNELTETVADLLDQRADQRQTRGE